METSHLDYYIKHQISPVRYEVQSVEVHLESRTSLYRSLGITSLAIRGADVLEVAAGSGQNSLMVASQMPATLTLLEPNPTGVKDIESLYANQSIAHTVPTLVCQKLEDYLPSQKFDIVICENWLGTSENERLLLRKLSTFVAPQGILVLTAVSPIGFMPNMLRRALAARLWRKGLSFQEETGLLVSAFANHLANLESMTRSAVDWVHDNMMNPAYFGLCLSVPMILDEVGSKLEVLGANPKFAQDWRWFKSLSGVKRQFNQQFLEEYHAYSHGLFDYRDAVARGNSSVNKTAEAAALHAIQMVKLFDADVRNGGQDDVSLRVNVIRAFQNFASTISQTVSSDARAAFDEGIDLLAKESLVPYDISNAIHFSELFGRETLYLSMQSNEYELVN